MDVGNEVKCRLFIGIEQEGINTGKKMLFVVGDVPIQKIYAQMHKHAIKDVYFGAGGRFDFNVDVVTTLLSLANNTGLPTIESVTIESPLYDDRVFNKLQLASLRNVYWVIPFLWKGNILSDGVKALEPLHSLTTYSHKIFAKADLGNRVYVFPVNEMFQNKLDTGYDGDVTVYEE